MFSPHHVSHFMCHVSHVRYNMSRVMCHNFCFVILKQNGGASVWRVLWSAFFGRKQYKHIVYLLLVVYLLTFFEIVSFCNEEKITKTRNFFLAWAQALLETWLVSKQELSQAPKYHFPPSPSQAHLLYPTCFQARAEPGSDFEFVSEPGRASQAQNFSLSQLKL